MTQAAHPQLPDWASAMEKRTMAMEQRLTKMEDIIQDNITLRADLTSAQELIAELQQQLATLQEKESFSNPATQSHFFDQPTSMKDSIHAPSTNITTTTPVQPTPTVTYATVAKAATTKKGNTPQKNKKKREQARYRNPTEGMVEWALRHFQEPVGPSGYTFLYLSTPRRTTPGELRKTFTILGVNTKRIIDIHAPTRGVLGILIHKSYEQELTTLLTTHKLKPLDFNPLSATVIVDPRYDDHSTAARTEKATIIHQHRIGRICHRLRNQHLGNAIITHFNKMAGIHHVDDDIYANHFNPATAAPLPNIDSQSPNYDDPHSFHMEDIMSQDAHDDDDATNLDTQQTPQ
jgi:uncharacterized coiled-coil protein SlyX